MFTKTYFDHLLQSQGFSWELKTFTLIPQINPTLLVLGGSSD